MKKQDVTKRGRLVVNKETLRELGSDRLAKVQGGTDYAGTGPFHKWKTDE